MQTRKKERKLRIDITLADMDRMIMYVFTRNANATKKCLVKIRELFSLLDPAMFEDDREMAVRRHMILRLLEGKLDKRIFDMETLAHCVRSGGRYDEDAWDIIMAMDEDGEDLSDDGLVYVEEYVSDRLTFGYVFAATDDLDDKIAELRSGEFDSLCDFNVGFRTVVEELVMNMRVAEQVKKHAALDFTSEKRSLDAALTKTIAELNRPSRTIKTGIKWLNDSLGGGFESGRCYLFLGLPKGFKSGLLLNCALWAKHYNSGLEARDPTKKPCVLYLTQENSINETIERLWSYYFGTSDEVRKYSPDEALAIIQKAGFDSEGVTVAIRYRANRSITTADMDNMIDDLYSDGLEVIMVVQDYVKRIKSIEKWQDYRLELGSVVDEMTVQYAA
jgi:hypothetical protein